MAICVMELHNRELFFRPLLAEDLIVKARQCPKLVGPQGIYRFLGELALAGCYSDSAPPSRFLTNKPAEEQRRIALLAGVKGAGVTHYDEAEAILAMANRLGMPAGSVAFDQSLVAELMLLRFSEQERLELQQFAELIGRPLTVEDRLLYRLKQESLPPGAVSALERYRRLPEAYRFYFFRNGYVREDGQEQPQGSIFFSVEKIEAVREWASTHPAMLSDAATQRAQEIAEIDAEILRLQQRRRELLGS